MNKLTSIDISTKLRAIREIEDPCDRAIALTNFTPAYKQSKFYKITKKPLQTLYYEIVVEDLLSMRTLLKSAQQFLNDLDADKLTNLFDQVNANTLATMKTSLDALDDSGLADLIHGVKRN